MDIVPAVNASLNAVATVLLIVGRSLAKRRRIDVHRRVMISAFTVSSLFLALYVAHKVTSGFHSTTFEAEGPAKMIYLSILFTHVILAMTVPFLAVALIRLGLKRRFAAHRRLARVAWPIWMYVSVTGVVIYVLLYHANPSTG